MKKAGYTDSFNTGSYAQDQTREPIDEISNRSRMRSANKMHSGAGYGTDGLFNALGAPEHMYRATHKANLPKDNLHYRHSSVSQPRGAFYSPAGSFGHTARTGAGRGVYGYGGNRHSATSTNAVPGHQNSRNGDNAVPGYQNTRRGQNAVPGRQNTRSGQNAVGNPPNRYGENALAGRFVPKGGGHQL